MTERPLDRTSPIPLYFQIAENLKQAIEDGTLKPGSRLDNELDLAERLGVSRPTVRQAVQRLVEQGLVTRRRGLGTVVIAPRILRSVALTSLHDDLLANHRHPATTVLAAREIEADDEIASVLALPAGGAVLSVERLRLAALSICSSASGTGSQSSCSSQIHSTAGSAAGPGSGTGLRAAGCCSARVTAVPYPVSASMPKTASGPRSSVRTAPLRSWLPVSTPIARWTGCVCSRTPLTSPGSSRAPSCATTTRVTTWRRCKAFSDKGPVWWRGVTALGAATRPA